MCGDSKNLPLFSISIHCRASLLFTTGLASGPSSCVSFESPVNRLQTNPLGSTLWQASPLPALCQSLREAGPISAVAGSRGSGGGGTSCQPTTKQLYGASTKKSGTNESWKS